MSAIRGFVTKDLMEQENANARWVGLIPLQRHFAQFAMKAISLKWTNASVLSKLSLSLSLSPSPSPIPELHLFLSFSRCK